MIVTMNMDAGTIASLISPSWMQSLLCKKTALCDAAVAGAMLEAWLESCDVTSVSDDDLAALDAETIQLLPYDVDAFSTPCELDSAGIHCNIMLHVKFAQGTTHFRVLLDWTVFVPYDMIDRQALDLHLTEVQ